MLRHATHENGDGISAQRERFGGMQDSKRLVVWHKALACFLAFHRALGTGSAGTSFGLRSQALRAAASISSNIAEGCGKQSTKEFVCFLDIAIGSARELENHLIVARDIEVVPRDSYFVLNDQLTEVRRMLIGLVKTMRVQAPRT